MTLSQISCFLAVAECGSFSRAAEKLFISQPAVSKQISALEEIAYRNGWINREQLLLAANIYGKSPYGQHLKHVAEGKYIY